MTFQGSYRALTYEFLVNADSTEVGAAIEPLLRQFSATLSAGAPTYAVDHDPSDAGGSTYRVFLDGRLESRSDSMAAAVDYVVWRASVEAVARAEDLLALHAGAVSWRGRGVLLSAAPDSGKTTLTAALTSAGFRYFTDEAALIDPASGLLHPFPRSLWMDSSAVDLVPGLRSRVNESTSGEERAQYHVRPDDLRRDAIGRACRVRYVIFPSYHASASVELTPVSRGEALLGLSQNSFNLQTFGRRGIELLARLLRDAQPCRLRMGDLSDAVATVAQLVKGR
jgi:hypothetical protein